MCSKFLIYIIILIVKIIFKIKIIIFVLYITFGHLIVLFEEIWLNPHLLYICIKPHKNDN